MLRKTNTVALLRGARVAKKERVTLSALPGRAHPRLAKKHYLSGASDAALASPVRGASRRALHACPGPTEVPTTSSAFARRLHGVYSGQTFDARHGKSRSHHVYR